MTFEFSCRLLCECEGDGCQECNADIAIDELPTPVEVADQLLNNAFFTDDQASYIASEVYQPLIGIIEKLNSKINQLARAIPDEVIK